MDEQIEKFHNRLRETGFRIQSDYLLTRMDYVTVLDWFNDDHHHYIAMIMDEKEYKNTPDLGVYWADKVIDILSVTTPKTKVGKWLIPFIRKHL